MKKAVKTARQALPSLVVLQKLWAQRAALRRRTNHVLLLNRNERRTVGEVAANEAGVSQGVLFEGIFGKEEEEEDEDEDEDLDEEEEEEEELDKEEKEEKEKSEALRELQDPTIANLSSSEFAALIQSKRQTKSKAQQKPDKSISKPDKSTSKPTSKPDQSTSKPDQSISNSTLNPDQSISNSTPNPDQSTSKPDLDAGARKQRKGLSIRKLQSFLSTLPESALYDYGNKLRVVIPLVSRLLTEGSRVIVFARYLKMLLIVDECFRRKGIRTIHYNGTLGLEQRSAALRAFKESGSGVLLITVGAGGEGITITEADRIVLLDPNWNPTVDEQAIDRA